MAIKQRWIILLAIFFLLLGTAYWVDQSEQKHQQRILEEGHFSQFFALNWDEVDAVSVPNGFLALEDGIWRETNVNYTANVEKIKKILSYLANIRLLKDISKSVDRDFLKESFKDPARIEFFQNKKRVSVEIGSYADLTGNFFIRTHFDKQIRYWVARDEFKVDYVYDPKTVQYQKYLNMLNFLTQKRSAWLDKRVFSEDPVKNCYAVKLETKRNGTVWIDRKKVTTSPTAYPSITYNTAEMEKFWTDFRSLESSDLGYWTQKKNAVLLGEITFYCEEKHLRFYLYDSVLRHPPGYYLMEKHSKLIYQLDNHTAQLFFKNAQDFWNRRPFSSKKDFLSHFAEMTVVDTQGKETVFRNDGVEWEEGSNSEQLAFFEEIFFQKDAWRIGQGVLENKELTMVKLLDRTFYIWQNEREVHLWDRLNNLIYYYKL